MRAGAIAWIGICRYQLEGEAKCQTAIHGAEEKKIRHMPAGMNLVVADSRMRSTLTRAVRNVVYMPGAASDDGSRIVANDRLH